MLLLQLNQRENADAAVAAATAAVIGTAFVSRATCGKKTP